jgi:putative flippase GtrA
MSDGRSMDEWLIRYLIVGLVGAVGTLALLYGLTLGESMAVTAGGAVGLAVLVVVLGIDLRQYRAA